MSLSSNLKDKVEHLARYFLTPLGTTISAILASAIIYLIINLFYESSNFKAGLIISIIIPLIITYPFSSIAFKNRKKIQKQIEELERLDYINKKIFTVVAHDVRSPIATLKSLLNVITSESLSMHEGKQHLKSLSDRTENLLVFLDSMLSWSRKQIEQEPLSPSYFSCNDTIQPLKALLKDIISFKNITLTSSNLETQIYADQESYAFIVRNILHNAIKFTPDYGDITINVSENEYEVQTRITDNGVGISKNGIEKILNSEEWYSTSGTSQEPGTGLGIKTCLYYLKQQKGDLNIISQPNTGTTVTISFPKKSL
jgi:signal transduction histidine kinase